MEKLITLDDLIAPNFDDVLDDILEHRHIHYVFKGGRGSCKSSFISIAIILLMTMPENKDKHCIIFRKTANTLRDSVYAQIQFAISILGLENYFRCTVSPIDYRTVPKEWLGEQFFNEAEHLKATNEKAYQHEYLGIPVGLGTNVFEFLEIREITDKEIERMDRLYAGVDWGFYPDPYAFILNYYNPREEKIYLIDENRRQKTPNRETAKWILDNHGKELHAMPYGIICDSAEPKSIADYKDLGVWNTRAAYKPPGSVEYGMKWLQSRTIVIDPKRTPHSLKEITEYEHERDKDGNVISGYPDHSNHFIDALRYSLSPVFMRRFSQA